MDDHQIMVGRLGWDWYLGKGMAMKIFASVGIVVAVLVGAAGLLVMDAGSWRGRVAKAEAPVGAVATTKPEVVAIYDEKADGRELLKGALARAKKENHRVLIQWGGNWCGWCVALHKLYEKDLQIKKVLSYEYELVMIDTNERNMALAKDLGAELAGVPFLTVLDAEGKVLVQQ